jgi:hypothetical protein
LEKIQLAQLAIAPGIYPCAEWRNEKVGLSRKVGAGSRNLDHALG